VNRWKIPLGLEEEITARDQACVYCRVRFASSLERKGSQATWEHIVNDVRIVTRENIARCCVSCNASKGNRELSAWLQSEYCKRHDISPDSVAEVVKAALGKPAK
jgi:5-methylcytosine-specific restriction endonuclease McrA